MFKKINARVIKNLLFLVSIMLLGFLFFYSVNSMQQKVYALEGDVTLEIQGDSTTEGLKIYKYKFDVDFLDEEYEVFKQADNKFLLDSANSYYLKAEEGYVLIDVTGSESSQKVIGSQGQAIIEDAINDYVNTVKFTPGTYQIKVASTLKITRDAERNIKFLGTDGIEINWAKLYFGQKDELTGRKLKYILNDNLTVNFENEFFDQLLSDEQVNNLPKEEIFEFGFENAKKQFKNLKIAFPAANVELKHHLSFKFFNVDINKFDLNGNLSILHKHSSKYILFVFEDSSVYDFDLKGNTIKLHTALINAHIKNAKVNKEIIIKNGKIEIEQVPDALPIQQQSQLFLTVSDQMLRDVKLDLQNVNIDFKVSNTVSYRIVNMSTNSKLEIDTVTLKFYDSALQTQSGFAIVASNNADVKSVLIKNFEFSLDNMNPADEKVVQVIDGLNINDLSITFKEKVSLPKLKYAINNTKAGKMLLKNIANIYEVKVDIFEVDSQDSVIDIENSQFISEINIQRKTGETVPVYLNFKDVAFNVNEMPFITVVGEVYVNFTIGEITYFEKLYVNDQDATLTIEPLQKTNASFEPTTDLIISTSLNKYKTIYWEYETASGNKQYLYEAIEESLDSLKDKIGQNIKMSPRMKKNYNFNIEIANEGKTDVAYNSNIFKHLMQYSVDWNCAGDLTEFLADYPDASEKIVIAPSTWDGMSKVLPLGTYSLGVFEKYSENFYLRQSNITMNITGYSFIVRAHKIQVRATETYKSQVSYGDDNRLDASWFAFVDLEQYDFNKMDEELTLENFGLDPNADLFVIKKGDGFTANTKDLIPGIYKILNEQLSSATKDYFFNVDALKKIIVIKKNITIDELTYHLFEIDEDHETPVALPANGKKEYNGKSYKVQVEFAGDMLETEVKRNGVSANAVFDRAGKYSIYPKFSNHMYYNIPEESKLNIVITPKEITISDINDIFEKEYMYNRTKYYQKEVILSQLSNFKNQLVEKDKNSEQIKFQFAIYFSEENVAQNILADVILTLEGLIKENYKIKTVNGVVNGINFQKDENNERKFIAKDVALSIVKQNLVYQIVDKDNKPLAIEYPYQQYVLSLIKKSPYIYKEGDTRSKFRVNITIDSVASNENLYRQYYIAKLLKDAKLKLVSGDEKGLLNRGSFFFEINAEKLEELNSLDKNLGTISAIIKLSDDSLIKGSNANNFNIVVDNADLEIKPFIVDVNALSMYLGDEANVIYQEKYIADNIVLKDIFAASVVSYIHENGILEETTSFNKSGQYKINLISNNMTIVPKNNQIYFSVLKHSVELNISDLSFENEPNENDIKTKIYELISFKLNGENIKESLTVTPDEMLVITGLTEINIETLKHELSSFIVNISVDNTKLSNDEIEKYNFNKVDIAVNRVGNAYKKDNVELVGKILYANKVQELKIFDATRSIMQENFVKVLKEYLLKNKKISTLSNVEIKHLINIDENVLSAFENNTINEIKIKLNGKLKGSYNVVHFKEEFNPTNTNISYMPVVLSPDQYEIKDGYLILKNVSDLSFYGVYKVNQNHMVWVIPLLLIILCVILVILLKKKAVAKKKNVNDPQEADIENQTAYGEAEESCEEEKPYEGNEFQEETSSLVSQELVEETLEEKNEEESEIEEEEIVLGKIEEETVLDDKNETHEEVMEDAKPVEKEKPKKKKTSQARLKERKNVVAQYIEED